MTEQRDFKGIWITREVWLDKRLNALEKVILAEIDSLDGENGCWASNQYLADFCQCSTTKVSTAVSKLIALGYIEKQDFDGRTRILKSRLSKNERQTFKKCEADPQKMKANKQDNKVKEYQSTPEAPSGGDAQKNGAQALFEEFWREYPRKVDKQGAQRAFLRIKDVEKIAPEIMAALASCKRSEQWTKEGGQFIPHPTTWIRQERWTATMDVPKDVPSSFDVDDYMQAALARTYGDAVPVNYGEMKR